MRLLLFDCLTQSSLSSLVLGLSSFLSPSSSSCAFGVLVSSGIVCVSCSINVGVSLSGVLIHVIVKEEVALVGV